MWACRLYAYTVNEKKCLSVYEIYHGYVYGNNRTIKFKNRSFRLIQGRTQQIIRRQRTQRSVKAQVYRQIDVGSQTIKNIVKKRVVRFFHLQKQFANNFFLYQKRSP